MTRLPIADCRLTIEKEATALRNLAISAVLSLFVFAPPASAAETGPLQLSSPDGRLKLTMAVADVGADKACGVYSLARDGAPLLLPSRLGMKLAGLPAPLGQGVRIASAAASEHDSTWKTVWGERSEIRDRYRQLVVRFEPLQAGGGPAFEVTFRAYDAGIAFRYTIPRQGGLDKITIDAEDSEFRFAGDWPCWVTYSAQGEYRQAKLSQVKPGCQRPLTVRAGDKLWVAVGEAALVDHAAMMLRSIGQGVVSHLSGKVQAPTPLSTPWRVVMAADSVGRLMAGDDIFLNLNELCAIADISWIKPGKIIREVTLTDAGARACVDFCAARGLQYIEFDAGWYGHEYSDASDATTVTVDPKRSKGPLNLREAIRYADSKGVGVILYVNRRALERQLDAILPLYKSWGVKGVKYGFVQVNSQRWTSWLHQAVRKAAEHRLMVDVHDEYRPTGYSRTYPNLMTQEGIRGDEASPPNDHTIVTLFSRLLAGPGDQTNCYFNERIGTKMGSHAYQLAKTVCLFSPWQFLFWYDRPAGIENVPELEFFAAVPCTWDETRVLQAEMGRLAVIARRSGEQWFVGCMSAGAERPIEVPLDFLPKGEKRHATIYSDDPAAATPTKVKLDRVEVDSATVLKLKLVANGGAAIVVRP